MPTPIQASSITAKLRSFFRLRGRQIFALDETAVPIVSVEDLTTAPYREGHQIRFSAAIEVDLVPIAGREFYFVISTAPVGLAFVSLADVAGVAVIERITFQATGAFAPAGILNMTVEYRTHAAILVSAEPAGQVKAQATNVDSASVGEPPSTVVTGQVPVALTGVTTVAVPALGTGLTIGRFQITDDRSVHDILSREIVIGDNLAIMLRTTPQITSGRAACNIQGSYYPLARS